MMDSEILKLILAKLETMDARLDKMDARLDKMDARLDGMDARLDNLETDVKDIKMMLENEIRVNIQRIAEGHLDLARNLQKAIKPSNELEMLSIQVRMLETDVRDLKRKIS